MTRDTPLTTALLLRPSRAWRTLAWAAMATMAALFVFVGVQARPTMAASLALFFASSLFVLRRVRDLPDALACFVVLAALLNGAGGALVWFDCVPWFDEVAHAWTGFAGLAAIGHLHARGRPARVARLVPWSACVGFALGAGWEAIESMFGALELIDTLTDLVWDVVGALVGGWCAKHVLANAEAPPAAAVPAQRQRPDRARPS